MPSSKTLMVAAGVGVACFVGYCIYFDRKRRNDPLYRQKVKQNREKQKKLKAAEDKEASKFPDFRDPEAMQQFLIREISLGEELVRSGDNQSAVKHFINALSVCGQPQQMLRMFQQALPPEVIQMIIEELPKLAKEGYPQSPGSETEGID
ncbi:Mitochondrial import receptor subunit TOM20-like protein B [Trichoplax sp. H2]|uniref:Translocase of outer mitochondrial membrane 20 n=1 Tax=Trichoplax adhaerens TaxID=10228 RepID=B3RZ37_TRIAD|nr:hypothetical protein TRIADDRAFT_57314 [Trichoplax adhaerens]EDV24135.1 hypothetical protein TRIADDRAFT_57314 [Trichoplax adhaerens]RDD43260.1 Mitochondrial import receptor subunit TOM20-like protein B [Trichoplax sp. H2]|eukprot:XP_002113661.1 hypothetical protein TRIADDRAFT_57314 [Trichoplax adhaerens]